MNDKKIKTWVCHQKTTCDHGPCFSGDLHNDDVSMECEHSDPEWKLTDDYQITKTSPKNINSCFMKPTEEEQVKLDTFAKRIDRFTPADFEEPVTPNCAICEWLAEAELEDQLNFECSAQGRRGTTICYNTDECQKLFKTSEPPTRDNDANLKRWHCNKCEENCSKSSKKDPNENDFMTRPCMPKWFLQECSKNEDLKYEPLLRAIQKLAIYVNDKNKIDFIDEIKILINEFEKIKNG